MERAEKISRVPIKFTPENFPAWLDHRQRQLQPPAPIQIFVRQPEQLLARRVYAHVWIQIPPALA